MLTAPAATPAINESARMPRSMVPDPGGLMVIEQNLKTGGEGLDYFSKAIESMEQTTGSQ